MTDDMQQYDRAELYQIDHDAERFWEVECSPDAAIARLMLHTDLGFGEGSELTVRMVPPDEMVELEIDEGERPARLAAEFVRLAVAKREATGGACGPWGTPWD